MRKTLKIAWREYKAAVRSKAFLIMVILMPVMMGGGAIAYKILGEQVDTSDQRIAVVDRSGQVAAFLVEAAAARNASEIRDKETGKKIRSAYFCEVVAPDDASPAEQRLALSERVRRKELHGFVDIGRDALAATEPAAGAAASESQRIAYYAENAALDPAREWLGPQINNRLRSLRLAGAGLDEATVSRLTNWTAVEGLGLVTRDKQTGQVKEAEKSSEARAVGVPMVMLMLMFVMIVVGATPLINSVIEEKMQRIAEVLLGSVRPFEFMMGKLLGSVGQAFTVLGIYVAGGVAVTVHLGVTDYIPYHVLPWFAVYLVVAVLMFGALFVAVGAACNDLKESQSMLLPVWLVVMMPMFIWMYVLREPLSSFATWASLIPWCTPLLMLVRQSTPATIPVWQPWVGLAGTLAFTTLCVWAAGRIFRVGILMQGQAPKFSQMLRWAIRG